MKRTIRYKRIFFQGIILILFVVLQIKSFGQDSLFIAVSQQNLNGLCELNCWDDETFYLGDFHFNNEVNFQQEIEKNLLFTEEHSGAIEYYAYLNQLTSIQKQNLIRYFTYHEAYFEGQLKEAGLPTDLKYLAPALSLMNPEAIDEKQRGGIWQLTHFQGVLNSLQINRLVDERFNEQKATLAFVGQLKANSKLFGSSKFAVLAYLAGNAKLKNTLARCGNNVDYSEVLKYLPIKIRETISFYQAMAIFLRTNTFSPNNSQTELTTISIKRQVHFQQIEKVLGVSQKELQFLNPEYRYSIIPGDKKVAELCIPIQKYDAFVMMSDSIYNAYDSTLFQVVQQKIEYAPAPSRQYVGEKVKDLEIEGKTKIKYTIQTGDVLGFIAEDYGVRVADLKYWNNIYNERKIQAGKKLDIFVDDEMADYYKSLQAATRAGKTSVGAKVNAKPIGAIPPNARKLEHIVKSGESPYVIAKKYSGVTPEAILAWNGITDARKIQIGQKLIIYLAQ